MNKTRLVAGFVTLAVVVTLAVRLNMTAVENGTTVLAAFWNDYRFFTIWTNTLVGIVAACLALGRNVPQWLTAGTALSIALVAGVYHGLLAAGRILFGLEWVIDHMLHTVLPIAFIMLWVLALPKERLAWCHLVLWCAYPVIYSVYAILRGMFDGTYPYFFLNVAELGAAGVALWVGGLALVFVIAGSAMIFAARRLGNRNRAI